MHLLVSPTQGFVLETQASIQGALCTPYLDDVVLGVGAPHEEPLEEAAARSFFGDSCS